MKKGLCLFLCMVTVAVTMCSCKSVKNKDAISDYTYVDSNGKVQVYQTDENGEVATDENGENVTTTTSQNSDASADSGIDGSHRPAGVPSRHDRSSLCKRQSLHAGVDALWA